VWQRIYGWLYPPRCVACGRFETQPLCARCTVLFEPIRPPTCVRCGAPRRALGDCQRCLGRVFAFDGAVCAAVYDSAVRRAIVNLKFRRWRRAAQPLADLLWQAVSFPERAAWRTVDAIVPVPIHPARRAMRGFNQAEQIAHWLSQLSGVPVQAGWLRRRFYRRPQVGLGQAERTAECARCVRGCVPRCSVRGRAVWLLDDVFTTGSTLDACARALKEAGASRVIALAVARDLREDDAAL
jgi:competence protein ComFC